MAMPLFPIGKVIVPIMELGTDPRPYLLGTGFFVGPNPVLVTWARTT